MRSSMAAKSRATTRRNSSSTTSLGSRLGIRSSCRYERRRASAEHQRFRGLSAMVLAESEGHGRRRGPAIVFLSSQDCGLPG
jgi:hypothetical protein